MKRFLLALSLVLLPRTAGATGFGELGQDIPQRPETTVKLDGYFRMRAEALYDLDLSRGATPSGQLLFPRPADPTAHTLTGGDMRLRTDLTIAAPGGSLAVKSRIDTLDDVALGSGAAGNYGAATSQQPPASAVRVKHVYAMALTPIGVLVAGRMGNHFGLGMLANGGDCADCDSGDSADRVAFLLPFVGHVFAAAYDFSASGPTTPRRDGVRAVDFEPSDDVHTVTAVVMRFEEPAARLRRRRGGKTTVEYGAYGSHRWQKNDIPATYVPTAQPVPITPAQVMYRGYTATAGSAWFRVATPWLRVEAEGALLVAQVDQASLIPGALFRQPVKSRQLGAALETDAGSPDGPFGGGLDAGYASGDGAPGFGANPQPNQAAPKPGDIDGPQASPPRDNRVDNFRFHPDYRIDRILFREIIGTVTDAVYLRPHLRVRLAESPSGRLTASLAGIWSTAVYASSTPGGSTALGTELDPTLAYESKDGFSAALEHGIFFPGAAFDNPAMHLPARTAQVFRLRMMFRFLPMRRLLPFLVCCAAACTAEDVQHPEHAAFEAKPLDPLPCVPNLDGHIDAVELRAALGVSATYLVSTAPRAVDVVGKPFSSGTRWTFTGDYADDRVIHLQAQKIDGLWFEASFSGASFVAPFDAGATVLAVYAESDSAIQLLGLVSADEASPDGKTLLVYDTPIDVYRFPLQPGMHWVSASLVKDGMLRGLPYFGKDTYDITVDATGTLELPDVAFTQAMRVRSTVTVEPSAGPAVVQRQVQFLFECFGEVARMTSKSDEPNDNFTSAAEVRRLGF